MYLILDFSFLWNPTSEQNITVCVYMNRRLGLLRPRKDQGDGTEGPWELLWILAALLEEMPKHKVVVSAHHRSSAQLHLGAFLFWTSGDHCVEPKPYVASCSLFDTTLLQAAAAGWDSRRTRQAGRDVGRMMLWSEWSPWLPCQNP